MRVTHRRERRRLRDTGRARATLLGRAPAAHPSFFWVRGSCVWCEFGWGVETPPSDCAATAMLTCTRFGDGWVGRSRLGRARSSQRRGGIICLRSVALCVAIIAVGAGALIGAPKQRKKWQASNDDLSKQRPQRASKPPKNGERGPLRGGSIDDAPRSIHDLKVGGTSAWVDAPVRSITGARRGSGQRAMGCGHVGVIIIIIGASRLASCFFASASSFFPHSSSTLSTRAWTWTHTACLCLDVSIDPY